MTSVSLSYSGDTYTLNVALDSNPVTVTVQPARDAYQLALADGFVGTRTEWLASLKGDDGATGPAGANAEIVVLTLAEYLALDAETQMDGRWYVIPK